MLRRLLLLGGLLGCRANGRHDVNGNVIEGLAEEELAVTNSGHLGDQTPSFKYFAGLTADEARGAGVPYPFPADRVYDTKGGPVEGKINVHLVPHSHDDTGWLVTVDQYFGEEVFYIIDTMTERLAEDPNRKFIYVETAFFARWWEEISDAKRAQVTTLVHNGQLEFINGGWCMHDEASPLWTAMVDQTTRGHQFLLKHFGVKPRGSWQIDPFGHSQTQAWLLGAEAGMDSLFWGRMDWQDRGMRFDAEKDSKRHGFEWVWQGSKSLGASAQVFAGNLFGQGQGGYSTWINFDAESSEQVNDDPARHDYNVDQWVDKFVQDARSQAAHTKTSHQLWACGTDFQYQNAARWYHNLDKLIHYVNLNGTVNAFYSTPTLYTDAKFEEAFKTNVSFEVRTDDVMPLGDNSHNYWSGYFTSRPGLKRQVRFATNLLTAARQLEVVTKTTAKEVGLPTVRRSPPVGDSWTDSLEGTVGVATHHDGMSGTERQSVTGDYEERISESAFEVEAGVALSLAKLLGIDASDVGHCNCNAGGNCLNMSVCAATTGVDSFTVAAWNVLGQELHDVVRLPVAAGDWACLDAAGKPAAAQYAPLDARTKSLPLLYLNSFNMTALEVAAAKAELANNADGILALEIAVPPVGLATFKCAKAAHAFAAPTFAVRQAAAVEAAGPMVVENDFYALEFDSVTKQLSSVKNKVSRVSTPLTIEWGWYNSSVGGCTEYPASQDRATADAPCSDQASGAYIFRPNSSELFYPGDANSSEYPKVDVVQGALYTEVRHFASAWASHTVRLYHRADYVEVEWTAGPIPVDTPWFAPVAFDEAGAPLPNNWGKELVLKYSSGLKSEKVFYTDSNGKEMVRRKRDARGPSYPQPYNFSEPVAANYYPVNALIAVDDGALELAVIVDASLGGSSMQDGAIELMVHRRLQADDNRGVSEPLNETMCGCNDINAPEGKTGAHGHEGDGGCECVGLTVRGRHWVVFDAIEPAHEARRRLSEKLNFPATLAIAPAETPAKTFSAVARALPPSIKLVTLTSNYAAAHGGAWLLRLSHLYEAGEHSALAAPVAVDLSAVFGAAGMKLVAAVETTLTANQPVRAVHAAKKNWNTHVASAAQQEVLTAVAAASFEARFEFDFPTVTIRPMEVRTFLATFV
ncbi:galactose mutarotase-like domain-containing protein [Pelagophyceae sp. CCMP2097]|nr:galactose mutarotase-like domain-containing protein [Pelagophyceae sp. CCMP2097]